MSTVPAPPGEGENGHARPSVRSRLSTLAASVTLAALVAVGVPVGLAVHSARQYFLFSPGTAPVVTTNTRCQQHKGQLELPDGTPCVRLLIPEKKTHDVQGKLLMVDVEVGRASPLQWAEYELGLLGKHREMVPVQAYAGQSPTSELGCQDTQQMTSSSQDAALAALSALHYQVGQKPLGALVETVLPDTPAWDAGIKCNDLITAVNGKPVNGQASFSNLLKKLPPGTKVTLTDRRPGEKKLLKIKARLAAPSRKMVEEGFANRAYLGVAVETKVEPLLPFPVSVNAGGIGGPSAGLAFTLAILDALSNGNLTGGHSVAATGTIAPDGQVGQVGGVREKTVAVGRAGAQVFFVPAAEYAVAKAVAAKGLHVVPATTLEQVLGVLERRYGGQLPGKGAA